MHREPQSTYLIDGATRIGSAKMSQCLVLASEKRVECAAVLGERVLYFLGRLHFVVAVGVGV